MKEKTKSIFKAIGIIVVALLIFLAWFFGYFQIIFYLFGFYAVMYFISLIFKTTTIINTILGIGGFLLWGLLSIAGLGLLYLALKIMFTESLFLGLLILFFGLPIAEMILYGIALGLGFVLGYPLIWFSEDLEKRFDKDIILSKEYGFNEDEYEPNENGFEKDKEEFKEDGDKEK